MKITPENITELKSNEIFVFGSNEAGAHGAGAAKLAIDKFGAVSGEGIGLFGNSYALPTKDKNIQTLLIESIKTHVENLFNFIKENPDKEFLITAVGCGLAGYEPRDIAPLFSYFPLLENVSLPKTFIDLIITKGFKVTESDMKCRGFKYELDKIYSHSGKIKLCAEGFHFCKNPNDCFSYYSFNSENRVFEIEAFGNVISGDHKTVSDNIRFVREIPWTEVLNLVNIGKENTGRYNTGDRNTGYSNTGYRNTGDRNTGDWNTGDWNTGDRNTGDRNTGDRNTGYRNTGDRNTGNRNTGDWNTGDWNTGDRNTGDWNTGNRNTGYSNTGNRNTGLFCTEDAAFPIFDEPSDWSEKDFFDSKVYNLLRQVDTKLWVPGHAMTNEEKEIYIGWKAADGFVRDIPFKQAFQDRWNNWTEESRNEFKSLPNFNSEKFEHITGVKVEE